MTAAIAALPFAPNFMPAVAAPRCHDEVRSAVLKVLRGACAPRRTGERRSDQRHPFPYPVTLTPVERDTLEPVGDSLVVLGKHLAEHGLDFYHRDPLPYRYMLVEIEYANGRKARLLLELNWCRFTKQGWYEHGGRFLNCVNNRFA